MRLALAIVSDSRYVTWMSRRANRQAQGEMLFRIGAEMEAEGRLHAAILSYSLAADLGHASSQMNLANLFDDHVDPPRPKDAVYWYKRAVRNGEAAAAYNLSVHYKHKPRWRIHWLRVAARMGDEDAADELREMFRVVRTEP